MAETLLLTALNSGAIGVGTAAAIQPVMSILPSAATALLAGSAAGTIASGYEEAKYYKGLSKQSELAAKAEELKGREQADKIRNALLSTLASQRAGFAARGIQIGSGTPLSLAGESSNQASRDINLAQFSAGIASEQKLTEAKQYKMQGKYSKIKGYTDAAAQIGSLLI